MKVKKADIEAAEAAVDAAKARKLTATAAKEAAQAAENKAGAEVYAAEEALLELLAMQALERLPADLASAFASGVLTSEQWSSLVRRDLAGKSKDRWSRNPYWLTRMGQKAQQILNDAAKP